MPHDVLETFSFDLTTKLTSPFEKNKNNNKEIKKTPFIPPKQLSSEHFHFGTSQLGNYFGHVAKDFEI